MQFAILLANNILPYGDNSLEGLSVYQVLLYLVKEYKGAELRCAPAFLLDRAGAASANTFFFCGLTLVTILIELLQRL